MDLHVEIHTGVKGIDHLASDWRRLSAHLDHQSYVHLWEWHRSYLEALAPAPDDVHYCAIHLGSELIAIVPLMRTTVELAEVSLTALTLPKHKHMQHSDLLVHPRFRQRIDVEKLFGELSDRCGGFDVLVLGPTLADSGASALVRTHPPSLCLTERIGQSDALPTASYERLLQGLSKNFRGNLRKARNKLDRLEAQVRVVSATSASDLACAFAHFLDVEASGWKGAVGTGSAIGLNVTLRAFYSRLVERLGPSGRCEIRLLMLGERPIAAQFSVLAGDRCYLLKIGYDEAYRQLAPGNLLLERLLKQYDGHATVHYVDLVSDAPWHESWSPCARDVLCHSLFRPSPKGLFVWAVLQGKQTLRPVHRRLSTGVREAIAQFSAPGKPTASRASQRGAEPRPD